MPRLTLNVPELLAIAQVLGVPPVLLLSPVGAEQTEIIPGRSADPWEAVAWISGDSDAGVLWARRHAILVDEWQHAADQLNPLPRLPGMAADPMTEVVEDRRRITATAIHRVRAQMRQLGLRPPALPAGLARLDDEGDDDE